MEKDSDFTANRCPAPNDQNRNKTKKNQTALSLLDFLNTQVALTSISIQMRVHTQFVIAILSKVASLVLLALH